MIDGKSLVHLMHEGRSEELAIDLSATREHCERQVARGLASLTGTTGYDDCALLWLLIRHFDRRHAFEIGTYIGTTAVTMNAAARRNGGICTTSDVIDYDAISPYSGLRFIKAKADLALLQLRSESNYVDFCFIDWMPDAATIEAAKGTFKSGTIIAVHDYYPDGPETKGNLIVKLLAKEWAYDGHWFLPPPAPFVLCDGARVNACTAFFLPAELIANLPPS